jgi:protein TonB
MENGLVKLARQFVFWVLVLTGALGLTLAFFLVLPLMQTISKPPGDDLVVQAVDTANIPPPPPPPEEEPEKEEEPEEEPPELTEEAPPLDLSQLELALNPGFSDGWATGDFGVSLNTKGGGDEDVDALFSLSELDQEPRAIYQPSPNMNAKVRRRAPGKVSIIFIVNRNGRVQDAKVQASTDPIFERPALAAVKQWKFEPGKRNGEPVRFRMRVPITFPKAN